MRSYAVIRCGDSESKTDPNVSTQPASGEKRKSTSSRAANPKKRRTDQVTEEVARDGPQQYGLGTHYPFASYGFPGAPPPPLAPPFNPTPPPNLPTEMSFNEFQWRLLNLCSEFYEAATELIVCDRFCCVDDQRHLTGL